MSEQEHEFLTVDEMAEQVRVSKMTIYRLVKAGTVPSVKVGGSFRIRASDWDAYLAGRTFRGGS